MSDDPVKRLAQLRKAYESGILDEDTYRAAVTALGEVSGMQATLEGSGAVVQNGGVGAGAGGVAVGGDVHGNVYVGPAPADSADALRIYRGVLLHTGRHLPLRGVDLGASDPTVGGERFELPQVYVDLDTTAHVPLTDEEKMDRRRDPLERRDTRPLGTLEATAENRHLVLLGDPGSGKSTFLGHLAVCLAGHGLEPGQGWLERLACWPETEGKVVPIPVILRDFSRWVPDTETQAEPRHLWEFIVSRLEAQNLGFAAEPLHDALEGDRAVVLLDGLDEVAGRARRTFARDAVAAFAGRYPGSRLLVSCRTLSYQDRAWRLDGFPAFELAPFDEGKIDYFVAAWYGELARQGTVTPEEATGMPRRFGEAVRRPDLWRLASNPLLLTVMALVHTHKGRLPDARALLYEDTVDILLWRWEEIKVGTGETAPRLRKLLLETGRTDVDLKRVLWQLAFEAHQEGGAGDDDALADIGELRLQKALAGLHPEVSLDWAQRVIQTMKLRAGLLLERAPEVFTFPHRTFQEYLAGAHLSAQADFARQAVDLVEEGAFWWNVVLLAVGRLVYLGGDTDKPLALVGELCPAQPGDDEVSWQKAWLAGEVLVEAGLNRVRDSQLGRDLVERVRHRLAGLLAGGHLTARERAEAGSTLALLGDPRFREDAWLLPGEPLLGFIEIPEGPFLMGSDQERDPGADSGELPQHEMSLPAYYVARYPVTQAQYRAFVGDTGHRPPEAEIDPERPYEWLDGRPPARLANHPVVLVTWHDAVAYCRWLTERLRAWEGTPEPLSSLLRERGWVVRLPTEAEWEKAARGSDGRLYPWGDRFDSEKCNMLETGIGGTSAVGCFPAGVSPYCVEDPSGNVWEWCGTKWRDSYKDPADESLEGDALRGVRGGSFFYSQRYVRCADRYWDGPYLRSWNYGFRVVVAPVPSGSFDAAQDRL